MRRIKVGFGGFLMLLAMLICDKGRVVAVYFLAALLHELGHLLAAKALKIGIGEIRFELSGVRICPENRVISYFEEAVLAAAGPLVGLLSALAVLLFAAAAGQSITELFSAAERFLHQGEGGFLGGCGFFCLSSLLQTATNLLPVSSFDGGRILYSFLARFAGLDVAERVLGITSALSAFVIWTAALYLMLKVSAGLGVYVFAFGIFAGIVWKGSER